MPRIVAVTMSFHFVVDRVLRTSLRQSKPKTPKTGRIAHVVKYEVEFLGMPVARNKPRPKVRLYEMSSLRV